MHFYGASLTHAHTCAYVSPLFFHGKESLFYETSQPGECGVWFDSHSCSLFRQLCTGELVTQRIEEELGRPATLVVTGGLAATRAEILLGFPKMEGKIIYAWHADREALQAQEQL